MLWDKGRRTLQVSPLRRRSRALCTATLGAVIVVVGTSTGITASAAPVPVRPAGAVGATSAYAQSVVADGPTVYYRLGESSGTTAADSSGNGVSGVYQPAATLGAGGAIASEADTAVSGNGTGPLVTADDSTLPHSSSESAPAETLEAWFNIPESTSGPQGLLVYGLPWQGNAIGVDVYSGGNYLVVYEGGTQSLIPLQSTVETGTWHLLDLVADGSNSFTVYLDDVALYTGSEAGPIDDAGTSTGLELGAYTINGSSYNYLHGSLDEVAIYPKGLSATDIQSHYTLGIDTVPGAPSGVTATVTRAGVDLSWTAPADGGSPITSYSIAPSPSCAACTGLSVTGSGGGAPATSTTVGGLSSEIPYTFTISAKNSVGTGPASETSASVTVPPILTVSLNGTVGSGAVVGSTAGSSIACGTGNDICSEQVPYVNGSPGTELLTAEPALGYYFSGWTNCDSGDAPPDSRCTESLDHDKTVTASFQACPVTDCSDVILTVGADPTSTGQGQVSAPSGTGQAGTDAIDCDPAPTDLSSVPSGCSASYPFGATVPLTAGLVGVTNGSGSSDNSSILGWSVPGCSAGQSVCDVTITRDASGNTVLSAGDYIGQVLQTATGAALVKFGVGTYTLNLSVSGLGTIGISPAGPDSSCSSSCAESYDGGTSVTLTAEPGAGQSVSSWGGSCRQSTGDTCMLAMTGSTSDFTASAAFSPLDYPVTVSIDPGGAGTGTVTSDPAGISCAPGSPAGCTASFPYGTPVTLTAHPGPSSTASWSQCEGTTGSDTCTVTLSGGNVDIVSFGLQPPVSSNMTLSLSPSSIQADGQSRSTADVYITDQYGNPVSGQSVTLSGEAAKSTDGLFDLNIGPVQAGASAGHYTATITASTRPSQQYLQALDTDVPSLAPAEASVTLNAVELPAGSAQLAASYTLDPAQTFTNSASPAVLNTPNAEYSVQVSVPAGSLPAGTKLSIFSADELPQVSGLTLGATIDGAIGVSWTTPQGQSPPSGNPIVVLVHKQVPENLWNGIGYIFQVVGNKLQALFHVADYGPSGENVYFGATQDPSNPGQYTCGSPCTAVSNTFLNGGSILDSLQNDARVIPAGAGNVIAAGGGNVIAAGGGNVIAAGGGNVIAAGGGNVIAAGGGNVIAAGGGNVIAAGGAT